MPPLRLRLKATGLPSTGKTRSPRKVRAAAEYALMDCDTARVISKVRTNSGRSMRTSESAMSTKSRYPALPVSASVVFPSAPDTVSQMPSCSFSAAQSSSSVGGSRCNCTSRRNVRKKSHRDSRSIPVAMSRPSKGFFLPAAAAASSSGSSGDAFSAVTSGTTSSPVSASTSAESALVLFSRVRMSSSFVASAATQVRVSFRRLVTCSPIVLCKSLATRARSLARSFPIFSSRFASAFSSLLSASRSFRSCEDLARDAFLASVAFAFARFASARMAAASSFLSSSSSLLAWIFAKASRSSLSRSSFLSAFVMVAFFDSSFCFRSSGGGFCLLAYFDRSEGLLSALG
mmetsp:Transcript_32174/g.102343  ORF Transcript_32174/g.102343 Transcript_32174/m.102343 type:complete len:346 (+) Transcript_32174:1454-2491(+)